MPRTPRFILILTGLLSAFILVSAAMGIYHSILARAWFHTSFEVTLLIAGVIGLLTAFDRFRSSQAMSLTCVGGVVIFSTIFAFITQGGRPSSLGSQLLIDMSRDLHTAARLAVGGTIALLAALTLMLRSPRIAFGRLALGLGLLAPIAIVGGLWVAGPLARFIATLSPLVQTILAVVGFFIFLILISAGLHFIIRSLESGVESPGGDQPDGAP